MTHSKKNIMKKVYDVFTKIISHFELYILEEKKILSVLKNLSFVNPLTFLKTSLICRGFCFGRFSINFFWPALTKFACSLNRLINMFNIRIFFLIKYINQFKSYSHFL